MEIEISFNIDKTRKKKTKKQNLKRCKPIESNWVSVQIRLYFFRVGKNFERQITKGIKSDTIGWHYVETKIFSVKLEPEASFWKFDWNMLLISIIFLLFIVKRVKLRNSILTKTYSYHARCTKAHVLHWLIAVMCTSKVDAMKIYWFALILYLFLIFLTSWIILDMFGEKNFFHFYLSMPSSVSSSFVHLY